MKTKLFAALTAVAILICLAVPAFAAGTEKDILDYAQISVDGFTKVVTITFPANGYDITAWQNSFAYETTPLFTHKGNSATFDFTGVNAGARPRRIVLTLAPLGEPIIPFRSQPYNGIYLDVSEIPKSAVCSVDVAFYCNEVDVNASRTVEMSFIAGTYNNGNYSGGDKLRMTLQHPEGNIWLGHYDWTIGDNSKFYIPEVYATVDSSTELTGRWEFAVDNFSIITTIDALKELEKNTGETNRLLEAVNKQLDDMMDYTPEPTTPGGGIGEDLDDAEDQLMDGAQQGLQDFTTYTQGFLAWLTGSATAFVAAGTLLGVILDVQIYNDLLYASLILGSFALFLGAAITIFKRRE